MPAYGIDFGTSNSAVAVMANGRPVLLDIAGSAGGVLKSVIFFPDEKDRGPFVGDEAVREYVACGMRGRLLQSVKSILPDLSFTRTVINGRPYQAEELAAVVLSALKQRADRLIGADVRRVTLGRPALFSSKPDEDRRAQQRLHLAALHAGFEEVRFELEPIAAALSYETRITSERIVFVGDLGAGTSDFALVRLSPRANRRADRREDILATGGTHTAGDDLDGAIMWHALAPRFGLGATYVSWGKRLPLPNHLFTALCAWERLPFIKADKPLYRLLRNALETTDRPDDVRNLVNLVEHNLGYHLFRSIEQTKIGLSSEDAAALGFDAGGIRLDMRLGRREFERMIGPAVQAIRAAAQDTLRSAGLSADAVDSVFITGGTSLVPAVRAALGEMFGARKLEERSTFTSVAEGLAIAGQD